MKLIYCCCCCRRRKGRPLLLLLHLPPPFSARMQMGEVLQSRCLFIQTESICRHSRYFRGETSHLPSHRCRWDPWWRARDNNYGRQLAGSKSRLHMSRPCVLWEGGGGGRGSAWFILTPQREKSVLVTNGEKNTSKYARKCLKNNLPHCCLEENHPT